MIAGNPLCVFFCTEAGGWVVYVCRHPAGGFHAFVRREAVDHFELPPEATPRGALEAARRAIADRLTVELHTVGHRPGCGCRACVDALAAAIAANLPPAGSS
jgi:hypothetical protein